MKLFAQVFCLVWAVTLIQACSDNAESPEKEIRRFIDAGISAAENRSIDELGNLMHENYLDQKGYSKKQLGSLLRAYFLRHKNIHLLTKIDSIEILADNQAAVRMHVAMAGSVISDVVALSALRARIYRFELQLVKQDDWLLRHAVWAQASIGDFQ